MDAAQLPSPNRHLVQIADDLLEHTRALRRQHEELRDRLAGIAAVPADQPFSPPEVAEEDQPPANGDDRGQNGLYLMVLQMALAGETPEAAKEQLRALGGDDVEHADELVAEVFARVGEQRPDDRRRRLFARRDG